MVSRSSSPCVGCSWGPSPALTTPAWICLASRWGVPGEAWRTTTRWMPKASILRAVSTKVSPLLTLLPPVAKSMVSAPRRLAARPKLTRVRVLFSKNRFTTLFPARSVRLAPGSRQVDKKLSEWSRSQVISWAVSGSRPRRWRCFQAGWVDTRRSRSGRVRSLSSTLGFSRPWYYLFVCSV